MTISDREFDEQAYLRRYDDVRRAVEEGRISSARVHFELHGRAEGRIGNSGSAAKSRSEIPRWWREMPGDSNRLGCPDTPFNIRTVADMSELVCQNLSRFRNEVDVVVGVPRSGLLPAVILALQLNLPLVTLDGFLKDEVNSSIFSRRDRNETRLEGAKIRALIVDDAIGTATAFGLIDQQLKTSPFKHKYHTRFLAIYATGEKSTQFENLEVVNHPRAFEWNYMHHDYTRSFCVDLDGILCDDPTVDENDDGPGYLEFIRNARPRVLPKRGVGAVVTARLERYRSETETWLLRHGIKYERLVMLDLPSGAERRRLGAHARYKADVYRELGGRLFVESDLNQAREIFELTRMPVYCAPAAKFFRP